MLSSVNQPMYSTFHAEDKSKKLCIETLQAREFQNDSVKTGRVSAKSQAESAKIENNIELKLGQLSPSRQQSNQVTQNASALKSYTTAVSISPKKHTRYSTVSDTKQMRINSNLDPVHNQKEGFEPQSANSNELKKKDLNFNNAHSAKKSSILN